MSRVIRVASQNCKCPVELLGHHQPRQRVGQRHRPQRQQQLRLLAAPPQTSRSPDPMAKTMCWLPSSRRDPQPPAQSPLRSSACPGCPAAPPPPASAPAAAPATPASASSVRNPSVPQRANCRAALQVGLNQRVEFVLRSRPGSNMSQRNLHGKQHISTHEPRAPGTRQTVLKTGNN